MEQQAVKDIKHGTVMAIDPSTVSTGYSVFSYGSLEEYNCIKSTDKDLVTRVRQIAFVYRELVNKYKPDVVLMEAGVVNNAKGSIALAQLSGALILASTPVPVIFVNNMRWKKGLLGSVPNGANTKELARLHVNKYWDVDIAKSEYDISDSLSILTYSLKSGLLEEVFKQL